MADVMSTNIYYHIYAEGLWQEPVNEFLEALEKTGLDQNLVHIGLVGSIRNRDQVAKLLHKRLPFMTIRESEMGWEQFTLQWLWRECKLRRTERLLYCHTAGAVTFTPMKVAWRRNMFRQLTENAERIVQALHFVDAVGCHYISDHAGGYFAGNMWWANSSYIVKLPEPTFENRWGVETWLFQGHPRFIDLYPGHPSMELFNRYN